MASSPSEAEAARVARILKNAGYTGSCGLEFEGKEKPDLAVPKSMELLRKTVGA